MARRGVPVAPHLLPELSGQLALCLPRSGMVEDIDRASLAALGALACPSGVTFEGDVVRADTGPGHGLVFADTLTPVADVRSEEHTSELQSRFDLVCRLLLEKKKKQKEE